MCVYVSVYVLSHSFGRFRPWSFGLWPWSFHDIVYHDKSAWWQSLVQLVASRKQTERQRGSRVPPSFNSTSPVTLSLGHTSQMVLAFSIVPLAGNQTFSTWVLGICSESKAEQLLI